MKECKHKWYSEVPGGHDVCEHCGFINAPIPTPVRDDWEKKFKEEFCIDPRTEMLADWADARDLIDFIRQLLASHTASVWKRAIESVPEIVCSHHKNLSPKGDGAPTFYKADCNDCHHARGFNHARSSLLSASREDGVK